MTQHLCLVADIGGTNTRVALARGTALLSDTTRRFKNSEFSGLEAVLGEYLSGQPVQSGQTAHCDAACVAVAGPVTDGVGRLTNLDWQIDHATLARATGASRAEILNDLQAQAHALGHLPKTSLRTVVQGPNDAHGNKLVIGVGTGFNIASVIEAQDSRIVPAAEAGHASLPVSTADELRLADHLREAHGFAAIEDMLSGRGLERIHAWLVSEDTSQGKAASTIMDDVDSDPYARRAVGMFIKMLGNVAGDLTLTQLPFGGVYFAGGVARAMVDHFEAMEFAKAFAAKGRFSEFMAQFPVLIIEDDDAALIGCASYLDSLK